MRTRLLIILSLLLTVLLPLHTHAQEGTPRPAGSFVDLPIVYDEIVRDGLTNDEFFDWWRLQGQAGDVIEVTMTGENGLAPLIGLLDPTLELIQRSPDGVPDSTVTLQYTLPAAGQYTIVATRAGNANGTTFGDYALVVRLSGASAAPVRENPYAPVVIACTEFEFTTAIQLEFSDEAEQLERFQITVYGLDGFKPAIYLELLEQDGLTDCSRDSSAMAGDTYTLPGEASATAAPDASGVIHGAQVLIDTAAQLGRVRISVGSQGGTAGRYLLLVQGFTIAQGDSDTLQVRVGPFARTTTPLVYMVAESGSRLDPYLQLLPEDPLIACDDAGRRGCEEVPSFEGAGATITANNGSVVSGSRFDAGLRLPAGSIDWLDLRLASLRDNTGGGYSVVVIGELPPPTPADGQ